MTGETRSTNVRAVVVGVVLLVAILAGLAAAFVLDRLNRPPVGTAPATNSGSTTQAPSAQPGPAGDVVIRSLADVGRLRSPAAQEVARAYLRYWDLYAAAMESRDTSRLGEVTAGGRLQEAEAEVGDLRAEGIAARIQVSHSFTFVRLSDTEATVRDEYVDSSYAINPSTRNPVGEPGTSERSIVTMDLRRVNGVWKVVGGRREAQ